MIVLKRSMNPGFAGIENELYYDPKTAMLFGDAKSSVGEITERAVIAVGRGRSASDRLEPREQLLSDRLGRRRAAGDADVDGQDVLERAGDLGAVAEDAAAERAVAERRDRRGSGIAS